MRLTAEELRTRLDAVASPVDAPAIDRADVDRRAAHHRRRRRVLGAGAACLVLLGGVVAVVDGRPVPSDDQDLRTIDESPPTRLETDPDPDPNVIVGAHTRTLASGSSVTLAFEELDRAFGPFRPGWVWEQPADCPRALRISVTDAAGTTRTGSATADPAVSRPTVTKALMPWNGGDATGAGATVPDLAYVVLRPVAGATYQLTGAEGSVLDEAPSDGALLVLFGPGAVSPGYRIRAVRSDGTVASEGPVPEELGQRGVASSRRCAVPEAPVDLDRDGAPADIPTETRAVDALVASLVETGVGPDALLAATDGAADLLPLARTRGFTWPDGLRSATTEIVWTSPTSAWVHVRLALADADGTERVPYAEPWIHLAKGEGGWRLSRESACAVLGSMLDGGILGSADGNC